MAGGKQRAVPQRSQESPPEARQKRPKFYDVSIRMGIDDHTVRMRVQEYKRLLDCWVLAGEDVVIRIAYQNREVNLVLRGHAGGYLSVEAANPERKIPTAGVVLRVADLRADWLSRQGHPPPGAPDEGGGDV